MLPSRWGHVDRIGVVLTLLSKWSELFQSGNKTMEFRPYSYKEYKHTIVGFATSGTGEVWGEGYLAGVQLLNWNTIFQQEYLQQHCVTADDFGGNFRETRETFCEVYGLKFVNVLVYPRALPYQRSHTLGYSTLRYNATSQSARDVLLASLSPNWRRRILGSSLRFVLAEVSPEAAAIVNCPLGLGYLTSDVAMGLKLLSVKRQFTNSMTNVFPRGAVDDFERQAPRTSAFVFQLRLQTAQCVFALRATRPSWRKVCDDFSEAAHIERSNLWLAATVGDMMDLEDMRLQSFSGKALLVTPDFTFVTLAPCFVSWIHFKEAARKHQIIKKTALEYRGVRGAILY